MSYWGTSSKPIQLRMPKSSPSVHFSSDILKILMPTEDEQRRCAHVLNEGEQQLATDGAPHALSKQKQIDISDRHTVRDFPSKVHVVPTDTGGSGFLYFLHRCARPATTPFFARPMQPSNKRRVVVVVVGSYCRASCHWTFGFFRSRSTWTRNCCKGSTSGGIITSCRF